MNSIVSRPDRGTGLLFAMVLVGLLIIYAAIAILIFSFDRGFDFTDEGGYVYLLVHPHTVTPFMDHFVWGSLIAPAKLTVIGLRYLTLTVLIFSTMTLFSASWRFVGNRIGFGDSNMVLLFLFCFALTTMGTLLYFSGVRPTFNYAVTPVACSNVFVASILILRDCRYEAIRFLTVFVMGVMLSMIWLARIPVCAAAFVFLLIFSWKSGPDRWRHVLLLVAGVIAVTAMALVGMVGAGYDISDHLVLLAAMASTSHDPTRLITYDLGYGVVLLAAAIPTALVFGWLEKKSAFGRDTLGKCLVFALACSAVLVPIYMTCRGDFLVGVASANPLAQNPALNSLGAPIHFGAMVLLLLELGALAAIRIQFARRWFNPPHNSVQATNMLWLLSLLYLTSLLPELGTNTGLWHRSVLSMGALFLMASIFVVAAVRDQRIAPWMLPFFFILAAVPVLGAIYANAISRPLRVDGSALAQTVTLNHPAVLKGLKVAPSVARLQSLLGAVFLKYKLDPSALPVVYGSDSPGIVVLMGARVLGAPWYGTAYPHIAKWNCALAQLGARSHPPLVLGIDVAQLGPEMRTCLRDYEFGPPIAHPDGHIITLLHLRQTQ